ncbi:DUF1801 domain-containing protein [Vibrio sp. qd031]|uniref:YdeI/OmpD-associated family protein n=1 Tax=Vibrio sp. qd031 TaxID=1603038 RepID=UPI0018D36EBD|nr:DUF1801 domain-containing protein [Vibrio sp. qd031]
MTIKPTSVEQFLESGCGRCELGNTPQCKVNSWQDELSELRSIIRSSGLTEEIKWHCPCYTFDGKNILMLSALKSAATVSFFKGALINDPEKLLEKPGENSEHARYLKVTSIDSVKSVSDSLKSFIEQAIKISQSGQKIPTKVVSRDDYPVELLALFERDSDYSAAFGALTPGRQRGYLLHFNGAKQSKTRESRILKCRDKVVAGKGWNER